MNPNSFPGKNVKQVAIEIAEHIVKIVGMGSIPRSVVSQRCRKWRFFSRKRLIPLGTVFGTPLKSRPVDNARMSYRINDFQSFTTQTLGHYCPQITPEKTSFRGTGRLPKVSPPLATS